MKKAKGKKGVAVAIAVGPANKMPMNPMMGGMPKGMGPASMPVGKPPKVTKKKGK